MSVFNTRTMERERTYPVTAVGHGAWGLALTADGTEAIVANWVGNSLTVFNRETGKVTRTMTVGIKPSYIAVTDDGTRAFAAGPVGAQEFP